MENTFYHERHQEMRIENSKKYDLKIKIENMPQTKMKYKSTYKELNCKIRQNRMRLNLR